MRTCARCSMSLDLSLFKIRKRPDGTKRYSSYCNPCQGIYDKEYYAKTENVMLYVVAYNAFDYCKIGLTQKPKERLKEIRNVMPLATYAAMYDAQGALDIEQGILRLFTNVRVGNSEVLTIPADKVVAVIDSLQEILNLRRVEQ